MVSPSRRGWPLIPCSFRRSPLSSASFLPSPEDSSPDPSEARSEAPKSEDSSSPDHTQELLAHLQRLATERGRTGAAIYRMENPIEPAEIVVGIGPANPPRLERRVLSVRDGSRFREGRVWHLSGPPSPVILHLSEPGEESPIEFAPVDLRRVRDLWFATQHSPDPDRRRPPGYPEIIGESPRLIAALKLIEKVARTRVSVLILGESGTGKELIGRAIHRRSGRSGRFVSENCAALSDSLLESELFGAERGAYTGAHESRAGLIEEAAGGTLFLDEIGEMGGSLQTKLLRVLQEREVRRVGSTEAQPVDFRVVGATHRDLDEQVREGRFRADLLFRLDVVRIELPALRERKQDIAMLAEHFLTEIASSHGTRVPPIDPDALELLENAPWPGNLRELRNELERAYALSPHRIAAKNLSARIDQEPLSPSITKQIREQYGTNLQRLEQVVFGGMVRDVLHETGGNKAETARRLGIAKTNLYRRLERYGIPYEKRR